MAPRLWCWTGRLRGDRRMNDTLKAKVRAIHQLYKHGDVDEFIRQLKDHPESLRHDDGSTRWITSAASSGKLEFVKALVTKLGVDVNEPGFERDPDNPFYEPEGCILHAASNGQLETVQWLLGHGARINFVAHGQKRCLPLIRAATNGHLKVVKLLVEHGADIDATWNGINAASQAEDFGQREVLEYLRSIGAKTFRETTPPDYERAHRQFLKYHSKHLGPISDWSYEISGNPLVTLRYFPPSDKCDLATLLTVGLSDHRLPENWKQHACTEIRIFLPADWPPPDDCLDKPELNWPIKWLERIAVTLRQADSFPTDLPVFMNGEPPQPLAPDTQMTGWVALKSREESVQAADYRWIGIHALFPIYTEEVEVIRKHGTEELALRFHARDFPLCIYPDRGSVCSALDS
ncbi:hypothetical protein GC176_06115 [bacterium]|nr:hypothetical protein [bacterium]